MWKCLNCNTENEQEICTVCGKKRGEMIHTTNKATRTLIACLIVLLVLLSVSVLYLLLKMGDTVNVQSGSEIGQQVENSSAPIETQKLYDTDRAAFIKNARNGLGVPNHSKITWQVGTPYLLEGAQELVFVSFFENGELVASADCNAETGEPARSIVPYTKVEKETFDMDLENVKYFTYRNAYGDFSIDVPTFLKEESSDDAGIYYVSSDGNVTMDIGCWEAGRVFNSVNALYDHIKRGIAYRIDYDRKKDNWFVISGEDSGVIYYQNHVFREDGMALHFILTYPKSREKEFDEIVTHIYHSFQTE